MQLYREIIQIADEHHIPDYVLCDILCMTQTDFFKFSLGLKTPPVFGLITFIITTNHALNSLLSTRLVNPQHANQTDLSI